MQSGDPEIVSVTSMSSARARTTSHSAMIGNTRAAARQVRSTSVRDGALTVRARPSHRKPSARAVVEKRSSAAEAATPARNLMLCPLTDVDPSQLQSSLSHLNSGLCHFSRSTAADPVNAPEVAQRSAQTCHGLDGRTLRCSFTISAIHPSRIIFEGEGRRSGQRKHPLELSPSLHAVSRGAGPRVRGHVRYPRLISPSFSR